MVEAKTNISHFIFRTNNGGEFNSKAFQMYCYNKDINHIFMQYYPSYQNRIVECQNRSLLEMARYMTLNKTSLVIFRLRPSIIHALFKIESRVKQFVEPPLKSCILKFNLIFLRLENLAIQPISLYHL